MKNNLAGTILTVLAALLLLFSVSCNKADASGNKLKSGVGGGDGKACAT